MKLLPTYQRLNETIQWFLVNNKNMHYISNGVAIIDRSNSSINFNDWIKTGFVTRKKRKRTK